MSVKIICLGIATLDRVWMVDELPDGGGKFRASDYLELGGGMAANAAVAAACLGGQVAYWGRAGEDTAGRTMQHELIRYGVNVAQFRLFRGARSSVSAIFVAHDGERMIVNFRGAGIPDNADWLPLDQLAGAAAAHADVRWVQGAHAYLAAAHALGIPTVLDGETADPDTFALLLPLVDHAIFSEPGLRSFNGGKELTGDEERIALLQKARSLGCRVAAVTRGQRETLWLDEAGVHHQPAFVVNAVDTTGAGDVFHGAYALAIGEGQSIAEAMRFSSAVAALKCTRKGGRAGIPSRAEAEQFLKQSHS